MQVTGRRFTVLLIMVAVVSGTASAAVTIHTLPIKPVEAGTGGIPNNKVNVIELQMQYDSSTEEITGVSVTVENNYSTTVTARLRVIYDGNKYTDVGTSELTLTAGEIQTVSYSTSMDPYGHYYANVRVELLSK